MIISGRIRKYLQAADNSIATHRINQWHFSSQSRNFSLSNDKKEDKEVRVSWGLWDWGFDRFGFFFLV